MVIDKFFLIKFKEIQDWYTLCMHAWKFKADRQRAGNIRGKNIWHLENLSYSLALVTVILEKCSRHVVEWGDLNDLLEKSWCVRFGEN